MDLTRVFYSGEDTVGHNVVLYSYFKYSTHAAINDEQVCNIFELFEP